MNASTVIKAREALIDGIYQVLDDPPTAEIREEIADWLLGNDYIAPAFFLEFGGDDE